MKALSLDVPESICSTTFIMPVPTYLFPFPDFLNSQSNQKGTYFEALFHDRLPWKFFPGFWDTDWLNLAGWNAKYRPKFNEAKTAELERD